MGNQAIIAKIDRVIEIPGADNIQVGVVLGESVIVSKDWGVGKVGVLFPVGVQLSEKMVFENSLSRNSNNNKNPEKKGFFEDNRRVRTQPFLKVKSEGFFAELDSLFWTGVKDFELGYSFDTLNGKEVCKKYISEETRRKQGNAQVKQAKKNYAPYFEKHVDSDQFRHFMQNIPKGALLSFHHKVHGTSARVANTLVEVSLPKWKKFVNKFFPVFPTQDWKLIVGTRNVVLDGNPKDGFHGSEQFRYDVAKSLEPYLEKGMTVYGEIAGFANGTSIMPSHDTKVLKDKAFTKKYGEKVVYTYGCKEHEYRFHIYRITRLTHTSENVDMSQKEMEKWCEDRRILSTIEVHPQMIYNGDEDALKELVESLTELPETMTADVVDTSHPSEGIIIRVDAGNKTPKFYKNKSYVFRAMEGICEVADTEDAS